MYPVGRDRLGVSRTVTDDETRLVRAVLDSGHHGHGDVVQPGHFHQPAELPRHDSRVADAPVERHLIDHEPYVRRIITPQDALLPFHACCEPARNDLVVARPGRQKRSRVVSSLQQPVDDVG